MVTVKKEHVQSIDAVMGCWLMPLLPCCFLNLMRLAFCVLTAIQASTFLGFESLSVKTHKSVELAKLASPGL